ncbi:MAG: PLP-dependent aminotransferase family protein [Oscillospiraceae bacterium]|nr:PLP-dependent aminotransferase family protein [Oscillospiraceae bacterium]
MEYSFSRRISALQPSAIREILKVTADPSVISLAAGNPSPETFPAEDMAAIAADIFARRAAPALQYGISEGYAPLRESTAARLRERFGAGGPRDDLIIVSGAQQGIEMAAKCFADAGDAVLCEEPSFIGALNALRSYGVTLKGVPCGPDGMDMDALEAALDSTPRVKLIYTIPTFQNPSGVTMPAENRRRLLALAEKHNVMVLEDDPYCELRYDGPPVPPIKSMDTEGRVIYCGSYSKVIAPGIRLGFVCAPAAVISKLTVAKQVADVHSNLFFQMLVHEYITTRDLDGHIERCRGLYRAKRDRMADALRACKALKFRVPDGGLFLWCELPDGLDGLEFCRRMARKGVAAVPGASFLADESRSLSAIRLNFSLPSLEQIGAGCARLIETLDESVTA